VIKTFKNNNINCKKQLSITAWIIKNFGSNLNTPILILFKNDYIQRYHKHTRKRSRPMDDLDATQAHT
jgi:hypothetical protein